MSTTNYTPTTHEETYTITVSATSIVLRDPSEGCLSAALRFEQALKSGVYGDVVDIDFKHGLSHGNGYYYYSVVESDYDLTDISTVRSILVGYGATSTNANKVTLTNNGVVEKQKTLTKTVGCKPYNYSKLKDVVYLVSADHVKDVHIDNGYAYISGLTETPLKINGFNIEFTENESLDERYKFTKTLRLSMHGYTNIDVFNKKYFAIIETFDGTFYMVNVDFPSKVTYTFNLSQNVSQTDFTLSSLSNLPTLKLLNSFGESVPICNTYNVLGIESLEIIECNHAVLNESASTVDIFGINYDFRKIEYKKDICSFQESFNGDEVTSTITFEIGFDDYKTSWHYNLLEFLENRYCAIIVSKNEPLYEYYIGFDGCLQPSYEISTTSEKGEESNKITASLIGTSENGLLRALKFSRVYHTETYWRYLDKLDNLNLWRCLDNGFAEYIVKQETDGLGNPTGNYQCLDEYEEELSYSLNIVDTFDEGEIFQSNECAEAYNCELSTDMPNEISWSDVSCKSYSLSAECSWNIDSSRLPSFITVSPMSGSNNNIYNLTVCNTQTPSDDLLEGYIIINYGGGQIYKHIFVGNDLGFIHPNTVYITCLSQNVNFTFNSMCPIRVISISPSLTYSLLYGKLVVTVPSNTSTSSGVNWDITVENCNEERQTVHIIQDHVYSRWATVSGYICEGDTSYTREVLFTGSTSGNINTQTSTERKGTKIKDVDSRCVHEQSKFEFLGHYYCVDGNKYQAIEELVSYDRGVSYEYKSGVTRLGEMVESASSWCNLPVTYSWVLRDNKSQCGYVPPTPTAQYRWVDSGTTCVGYDKYQRAIKQESYDSGSTWQNVDPLEYSATTLIEANSEDCGYVPPTPTSGDYLTFVAQQSGTFKFSGNSINYSLDSGNTWTSLASNTNSPTVSAGQKIMWKATLTPSSNGIGRFSSSGNFTVEGNPMSLLFGDNFSGQTSLSGKDYAFYELFDRCNLLTSAEKLALPATTLSRDCYGFMFNYCTSLTTAPELPATTLEYYCYYGMFYHCTSLATAPTLPLATLAVGCYAYMFDECASLTTVPSNYLPATTLETGCYINMFSNCTSLTTAPELPATTLAMNCYYYMFHNCTSLNSITCLATDISAFNCTGDWVSGVSSSGTFIKASSMSSWTTGTSGIPNGWTVQNA